MLSNLGKSLRQFYYPAARALSTGGKLTNIEFNEKNGVAVLTMNRPPVNGLNLELLKEIRDSIKEIETNKGRGIVLASSCGTVFSGGLDILEMYKPDQDRLREFWTCLQDTWLALYGSSLPTAAAINGHSPAGGCLLATCCEYRVMVPNFTIGLNETRLGIVAPQWFMASFLNVLPRRVAELALTEGKLFNTEEALNVGLIDAVAKDKEEALKLCFEFMQRFAGVNPFARAVTKQKFRREDLQQLINNKAKDVEEFVAAVNQPGVQKNLGLYLDSLKKKQKSKIQ